MDNPNVPQEQIDLVENKEVTEVRTARFGEEQAREAYDLLEKYRQGKQALDARIIEDKKWFQNRHWEQEKITEKPIPASGWLHNVISSKHADAMDNYPTPNVLPRERSDKASAETLSEVIPVILERNRFRNVYSDAWWDKLTDGACCYGVFWDSGEQNGLGDIVVKQVDLLNMYWQPGISNIQDSGAVFVVKLMDNKKIKEMWDISPEGDSLGVKHYIHDDTIDTSEMTPVVDYYYKVNNGSKTVTHYAKMCSQKVIFASENEPEKYADGFYSHGKYPFVIDALYPEKDTPVGFGYVALLKHQQLNIDKLESNILQNSLINTVVRYFVSDSANIKEEELTDLSKSIIKVAGGIDDTKIRRWEPGGMDGIYYNVLDLWINQMKEVAANRDVSNGSASPGITAASAIAALQEAGNKSSRDMIAKSYTAYEDVCYLVLELIRQFYNVEREFRITGKTESEYDFVSFSNAGIQPQQSMIGDMEYTRVPVFDIKVTAEKHSPFSQLSLNESAKEMYSMGFFNPQRAQEASVALTMMQFEGKDEVMEQVQQGQTMYNLVQQLSEQLEKAMVIIGAQGGRVTPEEPSAVSDTVSDDEPQGNVQKRVYAPKDPMAGRLQRARDHAVPDLGGAVR